MSDNTETTTQAWHRGFTEGKAHGSKFYDLAVNNIETKLRSVEAIHIIRDWSGLDTPFAVTELVDQLVALIRDVPVGQVTAPAATHRHAFLPVSAEPSFCAKCGESQDDAPTDCACA